MHEREELALLQVGRRSRWRGSGDQAETWAPGGERHGIEPSDSSVRVPTEAGQAVSPPMGEAC